MKNTAPSGVGKIFEKEKKLISPVIPTYSPEGYFEKSYGQGFPHERVFNNREIAQV